MPTVLIIDDEPNIRRMVGAVLSAEGYEVREAPDGPAGIAAARESEPDAILLDLMMPGEPNGLGVLTALRAQSPDVPVVMMSGKAGLADAVQATRLGAVNFLEKPLSPEAVLLSLSTAMELRAARREARALRSEAGLDGTMVGTSPEMEALRSLIARVAPTDARVLITGESGTGKELVAAAIHMASARRDRPFVRVNCAAIPRDLVESEMFGHEKGAFTGAQERRIGRFELAHTGTLFMDEVGDLGPEAQAKLLRAIEAREIERLGGGKAIAVDVRIVAATNKDLRAAVTAGLFREDLLFRLDVIPVAMPPLRERASDIPALVSHFMQVQRSRTGRATVEWSDDAMREFMAYRWPGNVRELGNIVERLSILHGGSKVHGAQVRSVLLPSNGNGVTPLADGVSRATPPGISALGHLPLSDALDEFERTLITRAVAGAGGNIAEAARRLQTDRPNLYRRMRRLGIPGGGE
ncbi:MAG: sigma-54-dependent Fis family transcriptional regulator [Gemmatimonadetes bacterium]|nr:sigma-54-dependent Fis family transcriptional regulator [Gemmatimonadota bacterium]